MGLVIICQSVAIVILLIQAQKRLTVNCLSILISS